MVCYCSDSVTTASNHSHLFSKRNQIRFRQVPVCWRFGTAVNKWLRNMSHSKYSGTLTVWYRLRDRAVKILSLCSRYLGFKSRQGDFIISVHRGKHRNNILSLATTHPSTSLRVFFFFSWLGGWLTRLIMGTERVKEQKNCRHRINRVRTDEKKKVVLILMRWEQKTKKSCFNVNQGGPASPWVSILSHVTLFDVWIERKTTVFIWGSGVKRNSSTPLPTSVRGGFKHGKVRHPHLLFPVTKL